MTLLDAATALCAHRATNAAVLTTNNTNTFERKMIAPCIVLARAWVAEIRGNTITAQAQLEDGSGNIYAKTKATLVRRNAKL